MSSFNLAKKLEPAKKAWKSFTKKLKKLTISIPAKKPTRGRKPALCSSHSLLIPRDCSPPAYHRHQAHHYICKATPAIYVDELFAQGFSNPSHAKKIFQDEGKSSTTAKQMAATGGENKAEGKSVLLLPQLQGIDERAEEFIAKFREDMKLQRKKSIDDFHEMLARGC